MCIKSKDSCVFKMMNFAETSVESLNKYISIQSIVVGIFCQIILMLYLWDEQANLLVMATSLAAIAVDVWKVSFQWKNPDFLSRILISY